MVTAVCMYVCLAGRATDVPVGEDQVKHLELSRQLAKQFNNQYGKTFPLPQTVVGRLSHCLSFMWRILIHIYYYFSVSISPLIILFSFQVFLNHPSKTTGQRGGG